MWWLAPVFAIVALIFAVKFYNEVKAADEGDPLMITIAGYVRDGAMAYLARQYKVVTGVFVVLALVLAFMAFGLVVERFDLFVRSLPSFVPGAAAADTSAFARTLGLVLILLGVLVLGISSYRYLQFKRFIASGEARDFRSSRTDLALLVIVAAIGAFMSVYVVAQTLQGAR